MVIFCFLDWKYFFGLICSRNSKEPGDAEAASTGGAGIRAPSLRSPLFCEAKKKKKKQNHAWKMPGVHFINVSDLPAISQNKQ